MNPVRTLATLVSFMAAASPALAHPGDHHEGLLVSLAHLLTEPDHLAMAALAAGIGWAAARLARRRGGPPRR